jgi:Protein of unknown function (DUF3606).
MPDDKSKIGKPDRDASTSTEPYELRYWSKKFGVRPVRLKLAVARVGKTAAKIARHLKNPSP